MARKKLSLIPGLVLAGAGATLALLVSGLADAISAITVAVVLGVGVGNIVKLPGWSRPGMRVASKQLLRVGIVLLGLRLVLSDLAALGPGILLVLVFVAAITVSGVVVLGRLLRVNRGLTLLASAGFAICGASAVVAAQGTVEADEEDVTAALGLVLLFGTLSIGLIPLAASMLGLSPPVAGAWVGLSVHDVGQAVATAELLGAEALEVAVVVKLGRVLLLAPVIVVLALLVRRDAAGSQRIGPRPKVVPLFVVGFLMAILLRSLDVLPEAVVTAAGTGERICFALALFAMGADVQLSRLRGLGLRPIVLGGSAWIGLAAIGLLAAILVQGAPAT